MDRQAKAEKFFWERVKVVDSGCWEWTGTMDVHGYGRSRFEDGYLGAHRFAFELFVGEIPKGMQIDHLCHGWAVARGECQGGKECSHRRCVNPDHLDAVPAVINSKRGVGRSQPAPTPDVREGMFTPKVLEALVVARAPTPKMCVICSDEIPPKRTGWNTCGIRCSRSQQAARRRSIKQ